MKTAILILFLFTGLSRANAQFDVLTYTNYVIRDMITFDNKLFIGGHFTSFQDTIESYWTAYYDDGLIVPHTNPIGGGGAIEFAVFDNELYAVGDWIFPGGIHTGVVKWNGTTWVMEGESSLVHGNIHVIGNYLYVVDIYGLIRRKAAGGTFEVFKDLSAEPDAYFDEVSSYQGKLCIMGSFVELEGVPVRNIALWNGTTWESLGTGMSPSIFKALVYQNELYVAGIIYEVDGQPIKHISKWNGTSWSDVGMSVTGNGGNGIRNLVIWGNKLFAFGEFDEIGNQPADGIASWNGQQWTTYVVPHPELVLCAGAVYNGRLYFAGMDPFMDRVNVYGYSGDLLNLDEPETMTPAIYPNPSNGIFTLSEDYQGNDYEVLNALGQRIMTGNTSVVDLSEQEKGVYFLRFVDEDSEVIRLVKE
ncbi:T9SS type A sorting domain-containing protein [Fluviicola taffensis]|uniref:T9SS type A sorting domain-containing protein n=1 Tax=Fluviicola taffensis TaxID=191579 RepID=UPI0031383EE0